MMNRKKRLQEDFPASNTLRALTLLHKIITKRTGKKVFWSSYPEEFKDATGKYSAIIALISNNKVIRYCYPIVKTGKKIERIDIFYDYKRYLFDKAPDATIDCSTVNIVQIVDLLVQFVNQDITPDGDMEYAIIEEGTKRKPQYILVEEVIPKTKGKRSETIAQLINQWISDKQIDVDLLVNTRLSHLWSDFTYWYNELANTDIPMISEVTFRTYILEYLDSKGLRNIFVKTVTVTKGEKQVSINTDDASEIAYKDVQHLKMSMNDIRNFMEDSIRGVMRGYMNGIVVCGKAGFGKTTAVLEIAKDEGKRVEIVNTIKNMAHLYNIFYKNNNDSSIILFDDCVEVFNKKYMGMVLAALDDRKERIINFPVEVGKEVKKFNPNLVFRGRIIILTNLPKAKLPQAYFSRTVPIEIKGTIQDIIDDIRINLENVLPEIPVEKKLEVLDFIEKIQKDILSIDFRIFKRCIIYYLTGSPNWKKHVYYLLARV